MVVGMAMTCHRILYIFLSCRHLKNHTAQVCEVSLYILTVSVVFESEMPGLSEHHLTQKL